MKIIRSKDIPIGGGMRSETSTFIVAYSPVGKSYVSRTAEGKILYLEEGNISVEVEGTGAYDLAKGKLAFLPPLTKFSIAAMEDSVFYVYRISVKAHFTEAGIPLEMLYEAVKDCPEDGDRLLDGHERVASFFTSLSGYIKDGLTTHLFYSHKARELLFLLKSYYSKEQLAMFFRPLTERDHEFSDFVLANYRNYHTVQELAEASCHSLSAFNRMFRKDFGKSPYAWIKEQKANDIYYDLTSTNTPIKELCTDHGFGSLAQFSNFCKSQFGVSPRSLRKMHRKACEAHGKI